MSNVSTLRVENEDKKIYDELRLDNKFSLSNHPSIFILAACIGYRLKGERVPLKKPHQLIRVSYLMTNPSYKKVYDAFDVLAEHEKIPTNIYIEEYANKGFKELKKWLSNKKNMNEAFINQIIAIFLK